MVEKKGKSRGYGHWVWQTYIHQLVLSKMDDGDIYHWCDVGCHFNKKGILVALTLASFATIVRSEGIFLFITITILFFIKFPTRFFYKLEPPTKNKKTGPFFRKLIFWPG